MVMQLKKVGATSVEEAVEEIEDTAFRPVERAKPVSFDRVLSTGSTLLDLAISGGRIRGGGLPGGIMVEIFGPNSTGKSALLSEIMACAQARGGKAVMCDPEGRYSLEHQRIYGVAIEEGDYYQPDTVEDMFRIFDKFQPEVEGAISVFATDSLAALSTRKEMDDPDGDKMGMMRAKRLHAGLRKSARRISADDTLFLCSNQVIDGDNGSVKTTGGRAPGFYSSVRIQLKRGYPKWKIEQKGKLPSGQEITQQVGIISSAYIAKNSEDHAFRECDLYITMGYGLDDIRANLYWLKQARGDTFFGLDTYKDRTIEGAIQKVEKMEREDDLRECVIDLWEEIQRQFRKDDRKRKVRE